LAQGVPGSICQEVQGLAGEKHNRIKQLDAFGGLNRQHLEEFVRCGHYCGDEDGLQVRGAAGYA
jgi:hypothetical protein